MSKSNSFYFENFIQSIMVSCEAVELLKKVLSEFDVNSLPQNLEKLHELEHKGDETKHKLVGELVKAFITPLERNDIMNLSENIDDVTDLIEDILIQMYITNISELREETLAFTDILIRCCYATKALLEEFSNFKKSKKLKELIININHIEEEGDAMHIKSMHNLHKYTSDPLQIIAWREIFDLFEKSYDACEDVADIVESITIGNT